jgi:hypothetical protein
MLLEGLFRGVADNIPEDRTGTCCSATCTSLRLFSASNATRILEYVVVVDGVIT